jgi:PPM family protein phosphatase
MELMTSGEFGRASRLSRKALRLYDELGLLSPAQVDPATGYRLYAPAQLEQARLVAWLRRLGMPLARIRAVSRLAPAEAAAELAAYWDQAETEASARRELAGFLIGYLSGKDKSMNDAQGALTIRYALQSDVGLCRSENEDSAYPGRPAARSC